MPKIKVIDEKDRKILSELDRNARQTDSEIAKKTGLSKQVVNYRIQKLVSKGIIKTFYTGMNTGKLGFNSYYVFLQLQQINNEKEKNLLDQLNRLGYIGWLVSGIGRWDVIVLVYAKSISDFDRLLGQIIEMCSNHLHEYNFTALIFSEYVSYKFLGKAGYFEGIRHTEEKKEIPKLDNIDLSILREISQNARISIVELSQKINQPLHIANYHLKNLIRQKTIEGFKPQLDAKKLGFQWNMLLLQPQSINEKRKDEFIDFCRQHEKIYYVTNTLGLYNLMLDIYVKSTEEFKDVLLELKEKFSDVIKLYESFMVFDEYKINYMPEGSKAKNS